MKRLILILIIGLLFLPQLFSTDMSLFYELVNDHRESIGLTNVKRDVGLEMYAEHYADVILDNGTIAHHLIDGEQVTWYVNHFSNIDYQSISEILQQGPYEKLNDFRVVLRNFLNSPDHRKYIEASYVETIGAYAVVSGNGMIIFVAYLGDIDGNNRTELTRYRD